MTGAQFTIPTPDGFSFRAVVYSHGWSDLKPFTVGGDGTELRSIISLSPQRHFPVFITHRHDRLKIAVDTTRPLSAGDRTVIKERIRSMFRLDESLDAFYALCRRESGLRWIPRTGGGRMLRSATVFEDIVKMICTTNCSWSLTKIIIAHLTTKLGHPVRDGVFSFPAPDAIAAQSERWLRKETSSGYRAPYLLEFCERIAAGELSVEHLRRSTMTTDEIYTFLRTIKGVGHYAAGNLLKLLGHYDFLSIDSWIRSQFSTIRKNGRTVSDAVIEKHYARYGRWRGLVCWMDMTKQWHIPE
jgi:3-methyladenine DNA glycosylase/8-oxoguanine DNA glycosylase